MVYICASPTSSTTVLDVLAPGPLSSTVRCLCFTQCTSCKSLFSFSLLVHYYCCNIRSLTQLFNGRKSSRDTTTTSFKLFSPILLLPRALLMVYICASPTSSTIELDVSVPGLLSSTVRCLYILHHIPFRQQQYVITIMFDGVLQCFCFRCFSGVPAWRLM